jgi:para-nitrobenzyl esterase
VWPAFSNVDGKVLYLGDPTTVGGVANLNSLGVFDAVYTMVRGAPFATVAAVGKGTR